MKMTTTAFLVAGIVGGIMLCTPNAKQNPLMDLEVSVIDETGSPIEDAIIKVGYYHWTSKSFWRIVLSPWKKNASDFITSQSRTTNRHGTQRFSFHTRDPRATISVDKDGWYQSRIKLKDRYSSNGRWTNGRERTLLIMKKITDPQIMLSWSMQNFPHPFPFDSGTPAEFDMFLREWMPPHGKGEHADISVMIKKDYTLFEKQDESQPFIWVTLEFIGKGNGLIGIKKQDIVQESQFKFPYEAPEDGYDNQIFTEIFYPKKGAVISTEMACFVFRIRSVIDDEGHITNAFYGQLNSAKDNEITVQGGKFRNILVCNYYINPNSNDRNLEPARDRFGKLIPYYFEQGRIK